MLNGSGFQTETIRALLAAPVIPIPATIGGIITTARMVAGAVYGVMRSIIEGYDCYQNALAERKNGILKYEFLVIRPADLTEARQMVAESVAIYNQHRSHLSFAYQTPNQVHHQTQATPT